MTPSKVFLMIDPFEIVSLNSSYYEQIWFLKLNTLGVPRKRNQIIASLAVRKKRDKAAKVIWNWAQPDRYTFLYLWGILWNWSRLHCFAFSFIWKTLKYRAPRPLFSFLGLAPSFGSKRFSPFDKTSRLGRPLFCVWRSLLMIYFFLSCPKCFWTIDRVGCPSNNCQYEEI